MIALDVMPRTRAEVSAHPLDNEIVLYDSRTGESFALNPTAGRIWSLCDGERTAEEIARAIASEYALPYRRALDDVRDLLEALREAGLIHN
jgi:PqqD family protein of HPr-rel-A system